MPSMTPVTFALAQFRIDDSNRVGDPRTVHACMQIRAVGELFRGCMNALFGDRGNGVGYGGVVQDNGDGSWRKIEMIG